MSTNLSDLAQILYLLFLNNSSNDPEITALGLSNVYYGDQLLIPTDKVLCIIPVNKVTELTGANRLVNGTITVNFVLYHSKVTNYDSNRRDCDVLADKIVSVLNKLDTITGEYLHSYVTSTQAETSRTANDVVFATSTISFIASTRERLGA